MSTDAYELLAMLMRYVFIVLGGLILLRALRQMRKDARAHKKELKQLPDAGLIGEVVDLDTGKSQPLPREGIMGSGGGCDIRLRRRKVRRQHALFAFVEGKGLRIRPHLGSQVFMENVEIKAAAYALHGTQVQLGDAHIRIRLFAGLNVPNPAAFRPDVQQPYGEEEPEENLYTGVPAPFVRVPRPMFDPADGEVQAGWGQESPAVEENRPFQGMPGQPWQMMPAPQAEEEDDFMPYESPQRHRRSDRR